MIGLMVFGAIGVWAVITCLMLFFLLRRIWRGIRRKPGGGWRFTAAYGFFLLAWVFCSFWYNGGQNYYYDAKVKRLCAKDGGIKVYETVTWPPEKFNRWGQPKFYKPTQGENTLGPEYVYKDETIHLRRGNPSIRKHHTQIFRKSDMKLLGETTVYSRGGGDFLSRVLAASVFWCPDITKSNSIILMTRIFTKGKEHGNDDN